MSPCLLEHPLSHHTNDSIRWKLGFIYGWLMGQHHCSNEHLGDIRGTSLQQPNSVVERASPVPSWQQHNDLGRDRHRSTTSVVSSNYLLYLRPSTICTRSHRCRQRPHHRSLWCRRRRFRGPRALSAIAWRPSLDCDNASSTNCVFDTSRSVLYK